MRVKYPRTHHLPWSQSRTSDDKTWAKDHLEGRGVVVTEKMDGENTTIYPDGSCHARSLSSASHPSRDYVRALAARVGYLIPPGYRVCGENLFAQHSISYRDLPDYFMMFSIWNGDLCLSWDETILWSQELGLHLVPVIYRGTWPVDHASLWRDRSSEGYVVRDEGEIPMSAFGQSVAKFVRAGHVQTDDHWMHKSVTPNALRG